MLHRVERFVAKRARIVGYRISVLRFVLSVKNERYSVIQRNLGSQVLLAENERLEGMKEIFYRKPSQGFQDPAVLLERDIIETTDFNPVAEIVPPDVCVKNRRPGHRQ